MRWSILALAVLSCVPSACLSSRSDAQAEAAARSQRARDRQRLRNAIEIVAAEIDAAGAAIASRASDYATKRESVTFRINVITAAYATLNYESGVAGLLDLWVLCTQTRDFFTAGAGRERFGPLTSIARQAAETAASRFPKTAAEALPPESVQRAHEDIEQFARKHPMNDAYGRLAIDASALGGSGGKGAFAWLPSIGLETFNPFASVGSGISEGAAALEGFSRVAESVNDTLALYPRQISWRLELVLYDLEERVLDSVVADVERVGRAIEVVPELPARVRAEVAQLLDDIEPELAEVRATLAEVREASAALEGVGGTFGTTAQSFEAMAAQLDTTLKTFRDTMAFLGAGPDEGPVPPVDPDAPPARPFDVLEFEQTARAVTAMAAQLDETLGGLRELVAADELGGRIQEVEASTRGAAHAIVWSSAVAALVVIVGFFGAFALFRVVSARWVARASP